MENGAESRELDAQNPAVNENRGNSGNPNRSETNGTDEIAHRSPSPMVETEKPVCAECAEKSLRLDSLQGRIAVMDAELMKLRRRVMEEVGVE